MKYIDEYRDAHIARALAADIAKRVTRPWVLMEICGGQTHTIMRYGLDEMLPAQVEMVHGPGCPVCVTPLEVVGAEYVTNYRSGFKSALPGQHPGDLRLDAWSENW